MNYSQELSRAGRESAAAHAAAAKADANRDRLIRQANYHGGMSARQISAVVGVSHQRVAQILSTDRLGPRRMKLHEAMANVLADFGTDWVPVHEVARLIAERRLYQRKDGQAAPPSQVRARAAKYPVLFDGTTDGTNRVRLRRTAD